jgi:acyl dehydratase
MGVNYGLNKVLFTAPVPAGGRVRGHFVLQGLEDIPGNGVQMSWAVTLKLEGVEKPCLVAEWLTRRYE